MNAHKREYFLVKRRIQTIAIKKNLKHIYKKTAANLTAGLSEIHKINIFRINNNF